MTLNIAFAFNTVLAVGWAVWMLVLAAWCFLKKRRGHEPSFAGFSIFLLFVALLLAGTSALSLLREESVRYLKTLEKGRRDVRFERLELPSGEICLLDHGDWGGDEPAPRNGLVFASSRLFLLLASMRVSTASHGQPGSLTSVLWYKEK